MRKNSILNAQVLSLRDGTKQPCESRLWPRKTKKQRASKGPRGSPFHALGIAQPHAATCKEWESVSREILIPWMPRSHQDIKALVRQAQLGHFHLADKAKGGRVAKMAHFDRFIVREDRSWESGVLVATCLCKREKSHTLNTSSQVLRMWWINCFTQKKKEGLQNCVLTGSKVAVNVCHVVFGFAIILLLFPGLPSGAIDQRNAKGLLLLRERPDKS